MPAMTLDSTTVVRRCDGQVDCRLDGEVAVLHLDKGLYFGLQDVGAHVWESLQEPQSVAAICAGVVENFDVDPSRCQADVLRFLATLQEEGLIEVMR
jgi:hypothetical protein